MPTLGTEDILLPVVTLALGIEYRLHGVVPTLVILTLGIIEIFGGPQIFLVV